MKTYVLVAGLIALGPHVEDGKVTSVTAFVMNAAQAVVVGSPAHQHQPLVAVHAQNKEHSHTFEGPKSVSIKAGNSHGTIDFDDANHRIFDFDLLYPGVGLKLRDECRTGDVVTKCKRTDGERALVGRIVVTGPWRARSIELNRDHVVLLDDPDKTTFGFVSYRTPHVSSTETQFGGAVLFETDENVQVAVDGATPVAPHQVDDCSELGLGSGPCKLVDVTNLPMSLEGDSELKCGERAGEADTHFELMYELFAMGEKSRRYLPFNRVEDVDFCKKHLRGEGPRDNPSKVKCPIGLVTTD